MGYLDEVRNIYQDCNNQVIGVICNRIDEIGGLSETDAIKLFNMSRTKDLNRIKKEIALATNKSIEEVNNAIEDAIKDNQNRMEMFYKAKGLESTVITKELRAIVHNAKKHMEKELLNLSKTTGFVIDGKSMTIRKVYVDSINRAIYSVSQGLTDYQTAMRQTVKKMADSGLRVIAVSSGKTFTNNKVIFDSGYRRRMDSQARMNILDGMRQFNIDYRMQQGKEFGADGIEITAHALCAVDHQPYQGKRYTNERFERLQEELDRPIGEMNCQHMIFPIIMDVSRPTYTDEKLKEFKDWSNYQVTYKGISGKEITCSRYEASQAQRRIETRIRELKDEKNAYLQAGQEDNARERQTKITEMSRYYSKLSSEVGLAKKPERIRTINNRYFSSKKKS